MNAPSHANAQDKAVLLSLRSICLALLKKSQKQEPSPKHETWAINYEPSPMKDEPPALNQRFSHQPTARK